MKLIYKVNTGTVKTSKHTQVVFRENDFMQLQELEKDALKLFESFRKNKVKNVFKEKTELSQNVELNMILHKGIKNISYDKKTRGCFITYTFDIN